MQKLCMVVIGAGTGRGQSWLATIKKVNDLYELVALCEPLEERAKENSTRWGVPAYPNLPAALEAQQADMVFCALPPDGNHAIVHLAAEAGLHVITEIPIAPTRPLADGAIEAARQAGVKYEITEQVWLWPYERLKKKILESGLIGDVVFARLTYLTGSYHGFNAIRTLLGSEPRRVLACSGTIPIPDAIAGSYVAPPPTDRYWETAVIAFDNGVTCLYEMPSATYKPSLWEIEGTKGQIIGNELYLGTGRERQRFPFRHEYVTVNGEEVLDCVRVDTDPPIIYENPYKRYRIREDDEVARVRLLESFHQAVTTGAEVLYGPQNARRDQELCIAVHESALQGGKWLELPLGAETETERRLHEDYRRLYGCDAEDIETLVRTPFPRGGVRWTATRQL